jgi:hypothetical protein
MAWLNAGLITLALVVVMTPVLVMTPQDPQPGSLVEPQIVQSKAKIARESNESSVRALVDAIFDYSILRSMPAAVRDRIFRADLAFRRGENPGVREAELVAAANYMVGRFGGPEYARTSVPQIRGFREIARSMSPHLGAEQGIPRGLDSVMSPVEAIYIASSLGRQKLFNPEYQVGPDEWTQRYQVKRDAATRNRGREIAPPSTAEFRAKVAAREVSGLLDALEHDANSPASPLMLGVDLFLDRLGIPR